MEDLIVVAAKESNGSGLLWMLTVWILAREFLPSLLKKLRNGKTPYLETLKEKMDYLYGRERDRHAVEKHEAKIQNRRSTD